MRAAAARAGTGAGRSEGVTLLDSAPYDGPAPEVSVVVATHARSELLGGLLDALAAQTMERTRFEVVVVDDCSPDATWRVVEDAAASTSLRLRALRLPANRGAGGARTAGLAEARGAVVAFTDDDCLPAPGWLEHLTAPLAPAAGGGIPAVVVQGRTIPWPQDAAAAGPWARTVWVLRPTWLFETCNVAYRRADLEAVGGFPSGDQAPATVTGRPAGEDALLGWRVVERGVELVFEPDALVHHRNFPATFADQVREQRGRSVFPALAARSPFARRALWGRWFLAPRTAATALAVSSLVAAAGTRRPALLAGVLPWAASALPEARARGGRPAVRMAQLAVVDLAGLAATVRGSIRHRALVL